MKNDTPCECTARCSLCGDVEFHIGVDRAKGALRGPISHDESQAWRRHMALVFSVHNQQKHGGRADLTLLRNGKPMNTMATWAPIGQANADRLRALVSK